MSHASTIPFVDLKRTFQAWRPDRNSTAPDSDTEDGEFALPQNLTWDGLLKQRRVVILAEPGSGKTRELQEKASHLRAKGSLAFFVRLDRLINGSFFDALGPALARDFERAVKTDREAYYFLGSVDEAKLTRPGDFYAALGKFSSALGPAGRQRARIFLSSRVSEWRHENDYDEVTAQLCDPMQTEVVATAAGERSAPAPDRLLEVKLTPLDRDHVDSLARAIGTNAPERFIAAVDDAFAWEFARRPLDVIDLAKFWNERGRLGTLTELVEAHVRRNLTESPERARETGSPLTEQEALLGAMTLAAASIFCQKTAFAILPDADGLDAAATLPASWSSAQINALLGRPLFDDASFGKRQFHHRRASEFLAAKWIEARMEHGCRLRALKEIFFETAGGTITLRPGLDATAAWLCGRSAEWARDFRAWVLAARPEIHLSFGDPEALTAEYRRATLNAIAARYADRRRAWLDADQAALVRFATPDLADDIARLFLDATTVLQLRWHLLHMAALHKLAGCAPAALTLAGIEGADEQLRVEAVELLIGVADRAALVRLAETAQASVTLGESFGMALIRALYPAVISSAQLVELAGKVRADDLPVFPTVLSRHFEEHAPPTNPGELLHAFLALIQRAPHFPLARGGVPVSQEFGRLRPVLLPLAKAVMRQATLTPAEIDDTALALLLLGERAHDFEQERINELTQATERHPNLRRAFFLRCIELSVGEDGVEPVHFHFFPLGHDALLKLQLHDLAWLGTEIETHVEPNRRLTLLRIAIQVWARAGRPHAGKKQILTAIRGVPALQKEFRAAIAAARRAPFRWWWETQVRYRVGQPFWWKNHWHRFRGWITLWRLRLRYNLRFWRLASGHDVADLCWLASHAGKESRSRWTTTDWTGVTRKFGPLVCWAARTGCKRAWRRHNPGPPSAKPDTNRTSWATIAGLNGIQAEWADGQLDFSTLPEADARTAAFYAVNELNAPATWLDPLAAAQPRAVGEALTTCIEHEWSMRPDPIRVYGVLAKVLGRSEVLADLVQPGILRLMAQGDPTQPQILDFALRLLVARRAAGLAAIAQARAQAAAPGSSAAVLWTAAWLRADADHAVPWLEGHAAGPATDALVVGICSSLHGGDLFRPVRDPNASYMQPARLAVFIRVIYRHVRPAEDQVHHGTYTPNGRDHAQEFRNGLVTILADQPGAEIAGYLTTLADEPALVSLRDYILDRRDATLRARTRSAAWRASDVREFTAADESEPQSDRDLYDIALRRLDDIKHAVESSDFSLREAVRDDDDEYVLRRFVAGELERRANYRYRPPQEVEIDGERRPDIRLEHPTVTGPINTELKWAENYTLEELFGALETQLVGEYLRPRDSRYGIFLLGMIAHGGKTRWNDPAGGPRLNFQQVVERVRARAAQLQATTPGVLGLEVVAIDFRPPARWNE